MGTTIQKAEKFRIILGNTDRSAAELISYLRRHAPDLTGIHIEQAPLKSAQIGEVALDFHVPDGKMLPSQLNAILAQASECMYQVENIERI